MSNPKHRTPLPEKEEPKDAATVIEELVEEYIAKGGTVNLNLSRRAGKTTFLKRLFRKKK